jgi:hypothetical protein
VLQYNTLNRPSIQTLPQTKKPGFQEFNFHPFFS